MGKPGADVTARLDTAGVGKAHVAHDHIRLVASNPPNAFLGRPRLTDDDNVVLGVEE
jgi:hypothetical protein